MTTPNFGIVINRPEVEPSPVIGADFSKIGIVTTSDDANATVLPVGVAKGFLSNNPVSLAALGTGYLADAASMSSSPSSAASSTSSTSASPRAVK